MSDNPSDGDTFQELFLQQRNVIKVLEKRIAAIEALTKFKEMEKQEKEDNLWLDVVKGPKKVQRKRVVYVPVPAYPRPVTYPTWPQIWDSSANEPWITF